MFATAVLTLFVNMLEMEAVALEIDVVERKGNVDEPPNELISTPFTLEIKAAPVEIVKLEIVPMNAVPLEIVLTERKGRVVDPPNEFISTPFTLEMKAAPVDKLLVEIESDLVMPELLIDVAFTVAAVVVPVTDNPPFAVSKPLVVNDSERVTVPDILTLLVAVPILIEVVAG